MGRATFQRDRVREREAAGGWSVDGAVCLRCALTGHLTVSPSPVPSENHGPSTYPGPSRDQGPRGAIPGAGDTKGRSRYTRYARYARRTRVTRDWVEVRQQGRRAAHDRRGGGAGLQPQGRAPALRCRRCVRRDRARRMSLRSGSLVREPARGRGSDADAGPRPPSRSPPARRRWTSGAGADPCSQVAASRAPLGDRKER